VGGGGEWERGPSEASRWRTGLGGWHVKEAGKSESKPCAEQLRVIEGAGPKG